MCDIQPAYGLAILHRIARAYWNGAEEPIVVGPECRPIRPRTALAGNIG